MNGKVSVTLSAQTVGIKGLNEMLIFIYEFVIFNLKFKLTELFCLALKLQLAIVLINSSNQLADIMQWMVLCFDHLFVMLLYFAVVLIGFWMIL